jgi:predicted unusual protein kinase regulating ubiquinone biosynthesis (AarF/ABC1/UbiB family)
VPNEKQIKKIKQHGMHRQLALSIAGASSGVRLLTNRATSFFLPEKERRAVRQEFLSQEANLFVQKLGELKGTYVKIGQMMALYGDGLLPREVTDALHDLEHKTRSLEWAAIEPVLTLALGERYLELQIDHYPIAAASLSQVHRATCVKDGRKLCIKVQYPGVAQTIDSDFKSLMQMLRMARWLDSGRDLERWMNEIRLMLVDEIDYVREGVMTERVAQLLRGDERYIVPTIEKRFSGSTVLTMNYIKGYEVTHSAVSRLSQDRRNALAMAMLDIFFKEVFEWGIMQTDPNFGNYKVQLRAAKQSLKNSTKNSYLTRSTEQKDALVLLDFGAVRELEAGFLSALQKTIVAAYRNDRETLVEGAVELNCVASSQPQPVKDSFADFCILLMEPFRTDKSEIPEFALNARGQYKWHESNLMKRVGKLGAKSITLNGFSSPPKEFALIARKLSGVFTFVTTLRAEIDAHTIIDQYLKP